MERVKTAGFGQQIKSSKDIIQFVDDDDSEQKKNQYSDSVKEKFR
jgi:hypothetical protein